MEYDPPSRGDRTPVADGGSAARRRGWRPALGGRLARLRRRLAGVRWRKWLLWGLPPTAAVTLGILGGMGFAAAIHLPEVDRVAEYTPSLITQIRDRHGEPFASFAVERRVLLAEDEIPELLRNAVIAIEDPRFFQHGGVDPVAVVRAQIANMRAGEIVEGAGTLTMQLARSLFLTRQQTWSRKIEEAFLAVEIEKRYTKQQILTLYLNLVNLGHGNYGMQAAARYYFNKSVAELSLPEAATLAGIVQLPSRYSPYRRADLVERRRNRVLGQMLAEGFISRAEHDAAVASPLLVVSHAPQHRLAPYYAEEVRKHLEATYGSQAVTSGGVQAWTALDPTIQAAAESALRDGLVRLDRRKGWRGAIAELDAGADPAAQELPSWTGAELVPGTWYQGIVVATEGATATVKIDGETLTLTAEGIAWTRRRRPAELLSPGDVAWFRLETPAVAEGEGGGEEAAPAEPLLMLEQEPELEGAVVVLESATGAVRAMVGGWDFERNKFNRATQARRQVGSAFKPFVLGAALEAGYTAADTLLDAPTLFPGADNQLSYLPRNYYREFLGIVTLRRALEKSDNVAAVKLLDMVGVDRVIDFTRRMGIESDLPPYPSLALGVADLSPLETAAAYATVANDGTYVAPYLIERVEAADGGVLERHLPTTHTGTEARVAYVLTHLLEGVIDRGTATAANGYDLDLAGKTGTTDDYSDAWFVGFTPRYTLLTWVGYDRKRPIGRGMTGAEAALPIWTRLIEDGLADGWLNEGERFTPPPGVTFQTVEYLTGLLPGPGAERLIDEAFVQGTEPVRPYEPRWSLIMEMPWYQQQVFYIRKESERPPVGFYDDVRVGTEDEPGAVLPDREPAR